MLLLGSSGTGSHGEIAKAVDFDGTNDYLSRASDLTGNADGKTFTFSAWVWWSKTASSNRVYTMATGASGDERLYLYIDPSNSAFGFLARNSSNVAVLNTLTNIDLKTVNNTFVHILVSIDLSNTTKRHIYLNDSVASSSWSTYTNDNIDFTLPYHRISGDSWNTSYFGGRLSHVYLDYTYRDLSVEANRRLFITADRKPAAGQAALTPIIYLPMDDPTTAHINQGTGGNFTLNGVVARSGRGPNQYNVAYSDFDGANDYVNITGPLLPGGSKTLTFSCAFNTDTTGDQYLFGFWTSVSVIAQIFGVYIGSGGTIGVYALNSSGATILDAYSTAGTVVVGRNYTLSIAIDLTNSAHRQVSLNGNPLSLTWATYTNDYIFFNQASNSPITSAGRCSSFYFNGRLGDVWFDTSYIDLSIPANLAKFVTGTGIDAKPVDLGVNGEKPTGTPPIIYLPMYGNNAGKNYGSGGDFTVNSGPYPGARGPNEFWGNKADFDGSTGYLSRTSALTGVSDGKTFSASFWVNVDTAGCDLLSINTSGGAGRFGILHSSAAGSKLRLTGKNAAGTTVLEAVTVATLTAGSSYFVQLSVDLANTANRSIYVNGVLDTTTWTTYSNDTINLSQTNPRFGQADWIAKLDGKLSEFYFTTDYIDFSQEANRLLFRDAFGNPTDLPAAIAKGTVPNPAIYMRFDPANQGLNSGTGGNFTKSGTITDGGQL